MLKTYLKNILEISKRGDAREETYYATLQSLLNEFARQPNYKHIKITSLPKKTEAGNPDFRIWDGTQHIVGHIETKAPTVTHLKREKYEPRTRRIHSQKSFSRS
jgi:hypothetical protein